MRGARDPASASPLAWFRRSSALLRVAHCSSEVRQRQMATAAPASEFEGVPAGVE
jgi:hypothetical protein